MRSAPEKTPFDRREESSSPHPPLEGQSEGREAYFFRCAKMVSFPGYPQGPYSLRKKERKNEISYKESTLKRISSH